MRQLLTRHSVLPGFHLALGFTVLYLSLIVLVRSRRLLPRPPCSLGSSFGPRSPPRGYWPLTAGASLIGASINTVFGLMVAWVLVRYSFPGKRVIDALVDLPFALPTAVAGIALTAVYSPGR